MYRIITYRKTAMGKGITHQKNDDFKLEVHTNVDWAGSGG